MGNEHHQCFFISDEQITAHYVKHGPVNQSDNIVVRKYAASIQTTMPRNVKCGLQYMVTVWSQNGFRNSSESNNMSVVMTGIYV